MDLVQPLGQSCPVCHLFPRAPAACKSCRHLALPVIILPTPGEHCPLPAARERSCWCWPGQSPACALLSVAASPSTGLSMSCCEDRGWGVGAGKGAVSAQGSPGYCRLCHPLHRHGSAGTGAELSCLCPKGWALR
uniref:Uncharacterized protein n=1 Tax=Strigops habroptila TaxID=2489341 RepID=A0A672UFT2_STRHB